MKYEHGNYTLKEIEIKIHDARRRVEGLLDLNRMDIPLPEDELENLVNDLAEAQRLMQNYYLMFKNGPIVEEIVLEAPKTNNNVLEFPGNNKKKE